MQVTVTGRKADVPASVRDAAVVKLGRIRRLFDRHMRIEVVFSEEANPRIEDRYRCEALLSAKGKRLAAKATGADWWQALDRAEAKLARQVRKHKTQLVTRPRQQVREQRELDVTGPAPA